jgi:hypothetical protein
MIAASQRDFRPANRLTRRGRLPLNPTAARHLTGTERPFSSAWMAKPLAAMSAPYGGSLHASLRWADAFRDCGPV